MIPKRFLFLLNLILYINQVSPHSQVFSLLKSLVVASLPQNDCSIPHKLSAIKYHTLRAIISFACAFSLHAILCFVPSEPEVLEIKYIHINIQHTLDGLEREFSFWSFSHHIIISRSSRTRMDRGKRRKKEETYRLLTSFVVLCTICALPAITQCTTTTAIKSLHKKDSTLQPPKGTVNNETTTSSTTISSNRRFFFGPVSNNNNNKKGYLANNKNSFGSGRKVEAIVPVHPKTHYLAEKFHRAGKTAICIYSGPFEAKATAKQ